MQEADAVFNNQSIMEYIQELDEEALFLCFYQAFVVEKRTRGAAGNYRWP